MDEYKVKLTPRAYRDIEDIFTYIAVEKMAEENAGEQTYRIWRALEKLKFFPASHQDRIVGRYASQGYKQLLIDNYVAIFRIDKDRKTVYVITVQYQGRNI